MTRNAIVPMQFTDANGRLTTEAARFLEELVNGSRPYSINKQISGISAIRTGAVDIAGVTQVRAAVDAAQADASDALNQLTSGGVQLSASPKSVTKEVPGGGAGTTDTSTFTITGGTAPFTVTTTNVFGDTLTVNVSESSPTSATSFTVSFSATVAVEEFLSATYRVTVTDSAGSPTSASVNISGSIYDPGLFDA